MRPSRRSRPRRATKRPQNGSSNCPFNRRAMRSRMPVGNTTPSIPPIASWPASWSAAGTRHCRPCTIEGEIAAIVRQNPPPLGERERQQLMQLAANLELAWSHPAATAATRKRILRTALNEIVVRREGAVNNMVLHWKGGDHTALQVKLRLNTAGRHHWPIPEDTMSLVRELARL